MIVTEWLLCTLQAYPGYSGSAPGGTVTVTTASGTGSAEVLSVAYALTGLEPGDSGGLHIHSGTSTSDAAYIGPHFYTTSTDPWTTTYDASNANGSSTGSFTVSAGTSLYDRTDVTQANGHVVVVHNSNGTRIGISTLTCATAYCASISSYPGTNQSSYFGGEVTVSTSSGSGDASVLGLSYDLTGLGLFETGGLHIHAGTSCSDANYIGPHYYTTSADPWTTTYGKTAWRANAASLQTSYGDSAGSFTVSAGMDLAAVNGRSVVVHDAAGSRVGCGVIGSCSGLPQGDIAAYNDASTGATQSNQCTATVAAYPGYSGNAPSGTVLLYTYSGSGDATVLGVGYAMEGLGAGEQGGLHMHTGTSCSDANYVGGHYYTTSTDPWTTTYANTSVSGTTSGSFTISAGMSLHANAGHVVVVHDAGGTRVGCGVVTCVVANSATISSYPGTTSSNGGTVDLTGTTSALGVSYSLTGLESNVTG